MSGGYCYCRSTHCFTSDDAFKLAYWSQYPDEDRQFDAISVLFRNPNNENAESVQRILHSLSGKDPGCTRKTLSNMLRNQRNLPIWAKGLLIHALGDAYAHVDDITGKLYEYPFGHFNDGHAPDQITSNRVRKNRYFNFIDVLSASLGGRASLDSFKAKVNRIDSVGNEIQELRREAIRLGLSNVAGSYLPEGGYRMIANMRLHPANVQWLLEKIAIELHENGCDCEPSK